MKKLSKMIGYIAYPKLGHPSPYSEPMPLANNAAIDKRYKVWGSEREPTERGSNVASVAQDPTKGLPGKAQTFGSYVHAKTKDQFVPFRNHETQHSIYSKIAAQHGKDFYNNLLSHTVSVLSPWERKAMKHIAMYDPNDLDENIAYLHNYLTDKSYREKVHGHHNLSTKAALNLHTTAKNIFKKLRAHAATLDYQTVQKREVPVFPGLGVPDRRKEIELINDPKQLYGKMQHMAHQGARAGYQKILPHHTPDEHDEIKQFHQKQAKKDLSRDFYAAKQGTTTTMGAVANAPGGVGYALSGVLRPAMWVHPIENESHGTKQHEEFHSQMNRIEQLHGNHARRALVDNLWEALPLHQQNIINHLQNHHAGDYYEQRNPKMAVEEKLARLFNHLNSPATRQNFHEKQFLKIHELPNGDVAPAGMYVVPGENKLYDRTMYDSALKDAHKNLLAAAEVANKNWLRPGHTNSEYLRIPTANPADRLKVRKSEAESNETVDHMHGYAHSMHLLCSAARFLSGKPTDESAFRDALRHHDGDVAMAALVGHGLLPTKENLKALHSITKIQDLHKSTLASSKYAIQGANPESEQVVQEVQAAINNGHVQPVKLGGKHSAGSLLVRSDKENWLIKPGDGKNSPAAGVAQESATQSEREVAFYKCAEAMGLGHIIPRAELIWLNGKQAAIIHMLPFSWKNLDAMRKDEPNIGRTALEPYRESGELFKWAVLDYVLGNPDRHGMNLMVSEKDDGHKIALIDHGSAFAGSNFNPGEDTDSWVPYYLRVWSIRKWKDLNYEERIKNLPRAPAEQEKALFHWVLGINPDRIAAIMQRYGVNAQPALQRLQKIKACKEPMDLFIGKLWAQ